MINNQRRFTPKQLKELREVNPWLTDGLFNKIIKDLNEDYSFMTDPDSIEFNADAFNQVKLDMYYIKVVNASHLLKAASDFPLIKASEDKYRDFKRYYLFNADDFNAKDDNYYLNILASLFEQAFTNVYRVYVDEETKKIAFAFCL